MVLVWPEALYRKIALMVAASTKPVIGITLDAEPAGGYAASPWYALRQNYISSVNACGGVAIALPHHPELVPELIALCDALVITGGAFDIDPALFGERISTPTIRLKPERTRFERVLLEAAMARDLPVLGICGGQQLIAALTGGSLIQHIPDEIGDQLGHNRRAAGELVHHPVTIAPGSLLHAVTGARELSVNTSHHQAVRSVGPGCVVTARAPDGVIEGIECPGLTFCLGVQWHPEYLETAADRGIFLALVEAARRYGERRQAPAS